MLREMLERHVYELSHTIGIRSIFYPDNYRRAEDYIVGIFDKYGFGVELQEYELVGLKESCLFNLACVRNSFRMRCCYPKVVGKEKLRFKGTKSRNIIVTQRGKRRPDEVLVVGGHYDSYFNPGADDNASAVAGILEMARMLKETETGCTVKFIAFANEEPPFFKRGTWAPGTT